MMKKSQAVSMDVMLAIVIFLGTIFVFYAISSTSQAKAKLRSLKKTPQRC